MTDTSIAIQATGLTKCFGGQVVLRDVHMNVARAECVAVTGANGSGKTTLLRCLAGMLRPTIGEVRWFGESPVSNPTARRLIGMVSHQSHLYPHLTLYENLLFAARMHGVPNPPRRADQLLNNIGLQHVAGCLPTQISRGMRQRLSVARALVHEPQIVVLAAAEATRLIVADDLGADWWRWIQLLGGFAVIFITAGIVLFEFVVED